jgi:DNA-directed RNA polymerase subunit alpha
VLYSSIEGTAVTGVKVKGVAHEFSTIEGIVEDVTDIVLNLKQLVVKIAEPGQKVLRIEATKKGILKAGAITAEAGVEIINTDLHIATLAEDTDFAAEITVSKGRRQRHVRGTLEGRGRDRRDPRRFELLADQARPPQGGEHARRQADQLRAPDPRGLDQRDDLAGGGAHRGLQDPPQAPQPLRPVLRAGPRAPDQREEGRGAARVEKEDLRQKLSMSISELDLSVRSANCLASERIETIGELVARSEAELLKVRNFGKTSLREVKKKLSDMSLNLGMDLESIFGKKTPPLV